MEYCFRACLSMLMLLLMTGCGPRSLEDFREEGEGITRSLIQELHAARTREDLLRAYPRMQKLFDKLVTVMIAAREFQEKHPKSGEAALTKENHELSDRLRIELNRIYQIEGGREIIEKCQEQPLNRLDAFEKRLLQLRGTLSLLIG